MSRNSVNRRSQTERSEASSKMDRIVERHVKGGPLDPKGNEPKAKKPDAVQMVSEAVPLLVVPSPEQIWETYNVDYWLDQMSDIESSNVELSIFKHSRGSLSNDEEEAKPTNEIVRQLAPEKVLEKPADWKPLIDKQRVRGVCFTLNNYTDRDQQDLRDQFDAGLFTYLVFGREVGGKKKTPHLQGYAHFKEQKSFNQIKEIFGKRYHFEYARATGAKFAERYLYCMKDEDFEEFGVRPQHGGQQKTPTIMDLIKEGKTPMEIREVCPQGYFHHRQKIENWFDEERTINPPKMKTKFYVLFPDDTYNVYEMINAHFKGQPFVFVHKIEQLVAYRGPDGVVKNIVLINPETIDEAEGWSYGCKILIKNGYKQLEVFCEKMVIFVQWFDIKPGRLSKYTKLNLPND